MKLKIGDFFIISFIILVAFSVFGFFYVMSNEKSPIAVIKNNGATLSQYQLIFAKDQIVTINEHVKIEIKNKKIRFLESDCPDQICVRTGYISKAGQSAACVPNKILIEIIGDKQEIDAVVK